MSNVEESAVLDSAHIGDIQGALGTIRVHDTTVRSGLWSRLRTLLAILGPGLIVMVGDNDAGAFSTYAQAGQNYGTTLLWTLVLLAPVLYVNQEMVLRLGTVTGVGHARLILERFGKFWGAFSVLDLFLLNALTIVTEFIGISLGMDFLGIPKYLGVLLTALLIIAAASTGNFKRFERFSLALVLGSLLLIPLFILVHPPMGQLAHDLMTPQLPKHAKLGDVMLLIIGIVGTTIAPWQLFFQQSYIIDKRITPRFIHYERADLWIGIVLVLIGAISIIACVAHAFTGTAAFGHFTDAGAVATSLSQYQGRLPGVLFAVGMIDASIIGAAAVSLSTAYAIGDVLSLRHSLHRKPTEAKGFYAVYVALVIVAAALVLIPGTPLGLLTNAVQSLAGVLLPSASLFLLLLCNDKEVLGPWTNTTTTNAITALVVGMLVILSLILTASVLFPDISTESIVRVLTWGALLTMILIAAWLVLKPRQAAEVIDKERMFSWRMPPLEKLKPVTLNFNTRFCMAIMRGYLLIAASMVVYKVFRLACS